MASEEDVLDDYARRGKPHPRRVLEHVVEKADGVGSVEELLRPPEDSNPAVTGARALAMHLLGNEEVLGLKHEVIGRMLDCPAQQVRLLQARIAEQRRDNPQFNAQVQRIIAAINADDEEPAAEPDADLDDHDHDEEEEKEPPMSKSRTTKRAAAPSGRKYTTIKPEDRRAAMLEILEEHGSISPGGLFQELQERGMDLSTATVRKDMDALIAEQKGRVTVRGERAVRRYSLDGRTSAEVAGATGARATASAATRGRARGRQGRGSTRKAAAPKATAPRRAAPTPSVASVATSPTRGAAMVPASGDGMTSLVQVLTGAGGGGDSAMMQLTDSGRRAVRAFVRGAAGGVVRDVDALMSEDGPSDPETVERARGGLLFLNLLVEGVAAAPGNKPNTGKK